MKKFIIILFIAIGLFLIYDILTNYLGFYIKFNTGEVKTDIKIHEKEILFEEEIFEIKGVNLSASIPGNYFTDFNISKKTYLKWFKSIKEMGANTIKISTIYNSDFYEALNEFNENNEPLYLIQGIWLDDYTKDTSNDAYHQTYLNKLISDGKTTVDIIHGNRKVFLGRTIASGTFNTDISKWVLAYLVGDLWVDKTVAYTNDIKENYKSFTGNYFETTEEANAFEALLARVMDAITTYETNKYSTQRGITFYNSPSTDPFTYPEILATNFNKIVTIDAEHINPTNNFISAYFASYEIFDTSLEILYYSTVEKNIEGTKEIIIQKNEEDQYLNYLEKLNEYHKIPIVITGYGYSTSRATSSSINDNLVYEGGLDEYTQAKKLVDSYNKIKMVGLSGAIIHSWQDEWDKKSWNTFENIDVTKAPYWSDFQTVGEAYGILTFDPGTKNTIEYIDGDTSKWNDQNIVSINGEYKLSVKYDEKFIYFMVNNYDKNDRLFIPIDTTQKMGSKLANDYDIRFSNNADFLIIIDGMDNSKVLVQERADNFKATKAYEYNNINAYVNPPLLKSSTFNHIYLLTSGSKILNKQRMFGGTIETGHLVHGNANPDSNSYNSLADFYINEQEKTVEIRIPWQLLNFSDPTNMLIHDDYYEVYGVENIPLNKIYVGIGKQGKINMDSMNLIGWQSKINYHERLKKAYYEIQKAWK